MIDLPVSAVIIVRDGERTLQECLESLDGFPEVIVLDNGSADRTVEIAESFSNVRMHTGEFQGFGPTKDYATRLANNDWVFSIDADEAVSAELMASIRAVDFSNTSVGYAVHRHNFFMGRRVRHSGWGRDWLVRLFHRESAGFNDAMVHELVVPGDGCAVRQLQGALDHDAVENIADFLTKIDRYSELRRLEGRTYPAPIVVLRSFWTFLRTYFFRAGFLDGWRGLIIAVSDANGTFYKYMKPYADKRVAGEAKRSR